MERNVDLFADAESVVQLDAQNDANMVKSRNTTNTDVSSNASANCPTVNNQRRLDQAKHQLNDGTMTL